MEETLVIVADWWLYARQRALETSEMVARFDRSAADTMRAMVKSIDAWRDEYMDREVDANEAAQLAGCDVSGIHRDIENGRLADRRPQGRGKHRVLVRELAELRGLRPCIQERGAEVQHLDVDEVAAKLAGSRESTGGSRRAA